jgi:DNA polymerase III subunit delta
VTDATFPVYLVRGDDPTLVGQAVQELVRRLVSDDDPALAVEEVGGADDAADAVAAVVDAAQTPPFLTARRVVVARELGRFTTEEVAPLVDYLADPLPTTTLVLTGGGGQLARRLSDAVKRAGHVVDAGPPQQAKPRQQWLAEQVKRSGVRLDAEATDLLGRHLGEDVGRLASLLDVLEAAHGTGARLGRAEVEPFLGQAGGVAPWELTDAIDRGDTPGALDVLHRMLGGGGRHPLQLLATLHGHYSRILRLDGAGVADEAQAAALLGLTGSTFPARKALTQARRLGSAGVARAIALLAQADLDLKGARDLSGEVVLEVLVARLSRLGTGRGSTTAARR